MDSRRNSNRAMTRRDLLKAGALLAAAPVPLPFQLTGIASAQDAASLSQVTTKVQPAAPDWMKDLIIYEVATKGFTSPRGPESGTFASLKAKLPYLQDLGITGIWLTGYSLCDPHHFYNIWTQYAVIDPEKFDPTLGTGEEFEALISDTHSRGIRVCLDVITHGLMNDCPIVRQHPAWFRGGSYRMTDFDWDGGHSDLDDWWVKIYTNFVTRYHVDGYRLDVSIYRPDLWERIRQNAAAAGHPIVIWEEADAVIPGVTDFSQKENVISATQSGVRLPVLVNDMPGFYDRKFGRAGYYHVEIQFQDGGKAEGDTKGNGPLDVRLKGLGADKLGRRYGPEASKPDGLPDVILKVTGIERKPIANILVHNDMGEEWELRSERRTRPLYVEAPETFGPLIVEPQAEIHIGTLAWGSSVQLSCHDNGWAGFPLDKNPYAAQGSRSLFGYSFLFSPMIPIFFSGEEFNATFHALPQLSPDLYGGKDAGKGRWLYGAQLDWRELQQTAHQEMFDDVRRMMAIRRLHADILAMSPGGKEPNLRAVDYHADFDVPVPYIRWKDKNFILIAGNRDTDRDAEIGVRFPPDMLQGGETYSVRDLWSEGPAKTNSRAQLQDFRFTVKRDKVAGGGLAVFAIIPVSRK
jgi:Alpha amylase, catalytic domain